MSDRTIQPRDKPFIAELSPPGSKSLTNRALAIAAMSTGTCALSNVLFADDTLVMLDCLGKLGFGLEIDRPAKKVRVTGASGAIPAPSAQLFCGNSGTTIRFLTALVSLGRGRYTLDGIARMRQRPIGELIEVLHNLGVRVQSDLAEGYPPVTVLADGLAGGLLHYGSAKSSQFLSAVVMAAPYARHELEVDLIGPQTSWPYVSMTMRLMDRFGLTPELIRDPDTGDPRRIIVPSGTYDAIEYAIEPDASNATYFLAAAAITPGARVTVRGLGRHSIQGDILFARVLGRMGASAEIANDHITVAGPEALKGIEVDLSHMPDTAQTLAVTALFAKGETTIQGLHTLRVKETDRLAALENELTKLGAEIEIESPGTLHIRPPKNPRAAAIDTYDDHRMAMSFALAGLRIPGVVIKDAQCVNKTYPEFFDDLDGMLGAEDTTKVPTT